MGAKRLTVLGITYDRTIESVSCAAPACHSDPGGDLRLFALGGRTAKGGRDPRRRRRRDDAGSSFVPQKARRIPERPERVGRRDMGKEG